MSLYFKDKRKKKKKLKGIKFENRLFYDERGW